MAVNGTTVGVPGVDVALDTASLRFDFFLSWARKWGMLGSWQVFACELHAALMCAFQLDRLADGHDQPDAIRAVAGRYRKAAQLIDATAAQVDPIEQWPAFYTALWAGRHQLGGQLDVAAARPSAPPPWGIAKVDQAGWGMPFPVVDWLSRTTFHRAMCAIHDDCPLDDGASLHAELRTTLDSIWCLSTVRGHRSRDAERQRHQDNQQRLQVLLATARQRFDPAVEWDEFREMLWSGHDTVTRAADAHDH
jgi:hypothetical protein